MGCETWRWDVTHDGCVVEPVDWDDYPIQFVGRERWSNVGWVGHPMERVTFLDWTFAISGISGADLPRMTAVRYGRSDLFRLEFVPPEAFASGRGCAEFLVWKDAPSIS